MREERGRIGLAEFRPSGVHAAVEGNNAKQKARVKKWLAGVGPRVFEEIVEVLLLAMGYEDVELTPATRDQGIDLRATFVSEEGLLRIRIAVQVKRFAKNLEAPVIQGLRGALDPQERGLIVTTAGFSDGAKQDASRENAVPIDMIDGSQLVDLLAKHELFGITRHDAEFITFADPTTKSI